MEIWFQQKTRPRINYNGLGKTFRKISDQKYRKNKKKST